QIFNNLVSNAIKFTRNGNITIEIQLKEVSDEHVSIDFSVQDTGIGITKDKQQLIFERFTQANSDITREFGGSGLGLTIIKRLLQLQNSDIEVESEEGKGSKFFFTIAFKKSEPTAKSEKKQFSEKPDLRGLKVLLVDDI